MKKLSALMIILQIATSGFAQTWTQKSDFPGGDRYGCASLTINGKAYVGLGNNGVSSYNDWWEYDPASDTWTQKTDFPGQPRYVAEGMELNDKGYVGLGGIGFGIPKKDWWEYNPVTDSWTQKANFPSAPRYGMATFTINDKGYFACGNKYSAYGPYTNQLWQYDPVTDTWSQKKSFPGTPRYGCEGFSIGDKGYAGLGGIKNQNSVYIFFKDFYEYDPITNSWSQKADYPNSRSAAISFVLDGKGYMGLGHKQNGTSYHDFNVYDPSTNSWQSAGNFPGTERSASISFSIDDKAYVGTGLHVETQDYLDDLWEFTPGAERQANYSTEQQQNCLAAFIQSGNQLNLELEAGEDADGIQFSLYSIGGQLIQSKTVSDQSSIISDHLIPGEYIVVLRRNDQYECSQKVLIR